MKRDNVNGLCFAVCTDEEKDQSDGCLIWRAQGFCDSSSVYYQFMMDNCYATCINCESKWCNMFLEYIREKH